MFNNLKNNMITMLQHIKDTLLGIIKSVGAISMFAVTWETMDITMKLVTFLLGTILSILAIRYYVLATKQLKNKM